jgi:hypothetical protein
MTNGEALCCGVWCLFACTSLITISLSLDTLNVLPVDTVT